MVTANPFMNLFQDILGFLFFYHIKDIIKVEEDDFEDEDGFVIGYTHKGGGITVVLMVEGFLEM